MTRPTLGHTMLLVLMLAACKATAPSPSGAPPSSTGSVTPAAAPSALPTTFTTATVSDPSLNNMLAETMTIPAGWKMDGTIMTAPCTTLPWNEPAVGAAACGAVCPTASGPSRSVRLNTKTARQKQIALLTMCLSKLDLNGLAVKKSAKNCC